MYYQRLPNGQWSATEDRAAAHKFFTAGAALACWRRLHTFPEDYEHCLASGPARAECAQAIELCL
jgi:hypothetical protein